MLKRALQGFLESIIGGGKGRSIVCWLVVNYVAIGVVTQKTS